MNTSIPQNLTGAQRILINNTAAHSSQVNTKQRPVISDDCNYGNEVSMTEVQESSVKVEVDSVLKDSYDRYIWRTIPLKGV